MKDVLNAYVEQVARTFEDPRVASMVSDALERTLADTLTRDGDEYFVITGDIPAMWLRDSTTQLWPYLRMLGESPELSDIVAGVLRRQFRQIEHDPYANSFNPGPTGAHYEPDDLNDDPWVWEQKYEIDSLAFPLLLAHRWWKATGRTDVFNDRAHQVFRTIVAQFRLEQRHEELSPYRFVRPDAIPTETLVREGLGTPLGFTGMTWSGFRPSDDACTYGYNVPGNLLAAQGLRYLAEIATSCFADAALAQDALALSGELVAGVNEFGLVKHPTHGQIYAYEVDGLGGELLMDDANMPSLLSLPLLSPDVYDPEVYARTRAFVLGPDNPWWFSGTAASGVGSPHTRERRIWPIALSVEGLTSGSPERQRELVALQVATDAGTGRIHEAFDMDDPAQFSRPWFSWADSMFCELALEVAHPRS
ncbi:glycoside hydrolase family 125 protein [Kineosporia babensis]|uniref:Glycoside hydrolase family 125 protein n=1 Tax=Kineosporia babensis TaxID=499548 RepID=A0A9X1NB68_9ACTN|nr:glycoside hydrolase family 125 protein [Kineosporia babensis]MCD5310500.1 glycoside hydrolase family 125 protein [Kineosporia babensis]